MSKKSKKRSMEVSSTNGNPQYFSDHFNIDKSKLKELGVFDPILNTDTLLFVEPMLVQRSSSNIIKNSFETYKEFFTNVLRLLKNVKEFNSSDRYWRAAKEKVRFPEYKSTCIGYGSTSIYGSGTGKELSEKVLKNAKEIIDIAKEDPEMFLLLPLFEEGIDADRISDMCQNIIDDEICQYTVDIMQKIGLEGGCSVYNKRTFKRYDLPYNPYSMCPVKLIPIDILSHSPLVQNIHKWLEITVSQDENLKDTVNQTIGNIWYDEHEKQTTKTYRREALLNEIQNNHDFFIEVLQVLKNCKFEHYDLEKDYKGVYRWLQDSRNIENVELSNEVKNCNDDIESISNAVAQIIAHFKYSVEGDEFWRVSWTKHNGEFVHVGEFHTQMVFYVVCSAWLSSQSSNIKISRRVDKESKKMDIKFYISGKNSIHVQVKHSNNAHLENIYRKQLQSYKDSVNDKGFYVIMVFDKKNEKQLEMVEVI